jgi:hypothetical protein
VSVAAASATLGTALNVGVGFTTPGVGTSCPRSGHAEVRFDTSDPDLSSCRLEANRRHLDLSSVRLGASRRHVAPSSGRLEARR